MRIQSSRNETEERTIAPQSSRQFAAELTSLVKGAGVPAEAALIGGSSLQDLELAGDIDLVLIDNTLALGEERNVKLPFNQMQVECVSYSYDTLMASTVSAETLYVYKRELQKLHEGHLLFDSDFKHLDSLRRVIAQCVIPASVPLRFATMAETARKDAPSSFTSFTVAADNVAIGWGFSSFSYRYSKPKWAYRDARSVPSPSLHKIYDWLAEAYDEMGLNRAMDFFEEYAIPRSMASLLDARKLHGHGRWHESPWPLRAAGGFFLAHFYGDLKLYRDNRDIGTALASPLISQATRDALTYVFQPDKPVPTEMVVHLDKSIADLRKQIATNCKNST